ncbi:hypothetical protein M404DRAFT_354968 [Pisolithus tinctorius Marx 270]|uniref:Uncharacterized protein n=1 Tax=Pisolithus tinctorius Marx 270 TaxID=870435 RepID=A0A0C3KFR9_PISTI|nr:hypothetical protein M404DRAFT_354968 [Pisolithus tinctorius Marx 270]
MNVPDRASDSERIGVITPPNKFAGGRDKIPLGPQPRQGEAIAAVWGTASDLHLYLVVLLLLQRTVYTDCLLQACQSDRQRKERTYMHMWFYAQGK